MKSVSIILASTSPRRIAIMEREHIPFTAVAPNYIEEKPVKYENPEQYAIRQAKGKARSLMFQYKNAIIIGADTIVVLDKLILGKPQSALEAHKMLTLLSGKTHRIITGYCVINTKTKEENFGYATGFVTIRTISQNTIKRYISTGIPMDKAGAYAVQEDTENIVKKTSGNFDAIVGLPIGLMRSHFVENI